MDFKEAEKRIAELTEQIEQANHRYYDLDSPTLGGSESLCCPNEGAGRGGVHR